MGDYNWKQLQIIDIPRQTAMTVVSAPIISRYNLFEFACQEGGVTVEITCYRDQEISRESHQLPAATYNLAHILLARSPANVLFIPILRMQYLAILDAEELVFLDGERKCWVDIAWRRFRPQARISLDDSVGYEAVYYREEAKLIMSRLQAELPRALQELAKKSTLAGPAKVLKFEIKR